NEEDVRGDAGAYHQLVRAPAANSGEAKERSVSKIERKQEDGTNTTVAHTHTTQVNGGGGGANHLLAGYFCEVFLLFFLCCFFFFFFFDCFVLLFFVSFCFVFRWKSRGASPDRIC